MWAEVKGANVHVHKKTKHASEHQRFWNIRRIKETNQEVAKKPLQTVKECGKRCAAPKRQHGSKR